jgi:hypothetical protein
MRPPQRALSKWCAAVARELHLKTERDTDRQREGEMIRARMKPGPELAAPTDCGRRTERVEAGFGRVSRSWKSIRAWVGHETGALREGKARTSERKPSAPLRRPKGGAICPAWVVVRQNQPIGLDRLVFNHRCCLRLLFAGVYDLLGADEDAVG